MKIYGIYNIKEKEQCEIAGTMWEVTKYLGLTPRLIGKALKRKVIIQGKYEVCYLFKE